MKKILFSFAILLFFLFSCKEEKNHFVKIELSNLQPQDIYAVYETANHKIVDTITYKGEKEFIAKRQNGEFQTLTLYFDNASKWITVYLESNHKILISGDAQYPYLAEVKGGKINELLSNFNKKNALLLKDHAMLSANNSENTTNLSRLTNLKQELRQQTDAFVKKHLNEEASLVLIKNYISEPDNPVQIDNYLTLLNPKLERSYLYKELQAYSTKAKRTCIGAKAPAFTVRNIHGHFFNTDSIINSYFILAFVPSWNVEKPIDDFYLKEFLPTLPKDSFKVMLVSLDENHQIIREQIVNEPTLNIVVDSAGQSLNLLDLYNVKSLPSAFLIDRKGNILLKTDSNVELKQKIQDLI